jgi:outer membrane usher protein
MMTANTRFNAPSRCGMYLILVALLGLVASTLQAAESSTFEELVLEVRVNSQETAEMLVVLRDADGQFWFDQRDLDRLRVHVPGNNTHEQGGQSYYALTSVLGVQSQFDELTAMLQLQLPAAMFSRSELQVVQKAAKPLLPAAIGTFLNYQLSAEHAFGNFDTGVYAELGFFSPWGVVSSTQTVRHVEGKTRGLRLDTVWSRDFPERLQTLTVGDTISDSGSWGAALRLGGIHFGTNYGIRPDLITTPTLTAQGSAVVPSSVDVYINNQRVHSEQVQPGPFSIRNLHPVSGAGDVRVVVRDALGREQVITSSFYSSPQVLSRGLQQYSITAGLVRERYAVANFDYGKWAASGSYRRGLTDFLTVETHGEYLQDEGHALGANLALRVASQGVISATVALGGTDDESGWLGGLGFEHRGERVSLAFNTSYESDGFHRASEAVFDIGRRRFAGVAQAGVGFGRSGSLSFALAHRDYHEGWDEQTATLGYSLGLRNASYLQLSVNRDLGLTKATSAYLSFSMAMGGRRSFESQAQGTRDENRQRVDLQVSMQESAPVGQGHGWYLSASQRGDHDARWTQRFESADVDLRVARYFGSSGQGIQARGALVSVGGTTRAVRAVDGSFALIDVAGIPDVPVYLENHLVTKTDARGKALLHNLQPYEVSRVSIQPTDLPFNTSIKSRVLEIQPAWRSGVLARFPVEKIHPAVFRLLLPDGKPVPAGSSVQLNGGDFVVAMDGFTYVTTLDHGVGASAEWTGGRCVFRVDPPPADDPMPDMGNITCRLVLGVER